MDDFSDYEDNISDSEEDNVEELDAVNDYVQLNDNNMRESDEILIDAEMHTIHSSNRKSVRAIISSSDEDKLPERIPIRRKKTKLYDDMWFNEQASLLNTEFAI
ncbi:hypothetical protein CDAR_605021 [Caerostris darwini]|uniref:Uncharacterized protein n=1 Tax=Caerostris darwini TaxID=1538125 RepID=A0AAV4X714_9ARAC|nr:hypothetical protein CDAR_605021 [Caerostris darwini]